MRLLLALLLILPAAGQIVIQPKGKPTIPTRTVEGTLRLRDASRLILDTDDKRTVLIQIDKQTDFGRQDLSKLQPGDHIRVDAREGDEAYLFAVTVELVKAGTPGERAKDSTSASSPATTP